MEEHPNAHELAIGLEAELRKIGALAPVELRMRILVAAHCAGIVIRELAAGDQAQPPNNKFVDQELLVRQILAGEHDTELNSLCAILKDQVRDRLAITNPGYAGDWVKPS